MTCSPCTHGNHSDCWHDAIYDICDCYRREHMPPFCRRCSHSREAHADGLSYGKCFANACGCEHME